MRRISIFLITVVLIVGMAGCGGVVKYDLTVSSTTGGSVTTPGEGTSTYREGEVVNLVAEAEEGYRFVEWTGDVATIVNVNAAITIITTNDNYSITANFKFECNPMVAAGWHHTVGLKSDGTLVAVGYNGFGQCEVGGWTEITQVAAGSHHTVGLKSDGTVVAVGDNEYGQCDVGGWANITQVAAGGYHTVGLEADGTVVVVGYNDDGRCNVGGWNLITGRPPINWSLLGGIIAAVIAVGLVVFFARRRRRLQLERRESLGEPESMSGRVSFVSKRWGFLRNPATTFWRQLAKDFLWLLLYPAYQTIGTLRHEGSHALAAMAEGAHIRKFVFWPNFDLGEYTWGYVSWEGSMTWVTLAAPYFCDLITFFVAFLIILVAKPRPRELWFNIGIIGMLSPFINSVVNYLGGLSGPNDVGRLLSAVEPLAVHLFFIITLLLYLWGIYYCYFRKRYQG